jgi:hypothetical protein
LSSQPEGRRLSLAISWTVLLSGTTAGAIVFGSLLHQEATVFAVRQQVRQALRLTLAEYSSGLDLTVDRGQPFLPSAKSARNVALSKDSIQDGDFIYRGERQGPVYVIRVRSSPGTAFHGRTLTGCVHLPSGRIEVQHDFGDRDTQFCRSILRSKAAEPRGSDPPVMAPKP